MGNEEDGALTMVEKTPSPSGGGAANMLSTPINQGLQGHEAEVGLGSGKRDDGEGGDEHPSTGPTEMEVDEEAGGGGEAAAAGAESPPGEQEKSVDFEPPQVRLERHILVPSQLFVANRLMWGGPPPASSYDGRRVCRSSSKGLLVSRCKSEKRRR